MSKSIYTHVHHIVPRYMGGTDDPSNLIELTVEEHAEAHRKLYEEYGNRQDYIAWKALSGCIGKEELLYQRSKLGAEKMAEMRRGKPGPKQSPETIAKRMKSIGPVNPFKNKKHKKNSKEIMSIKAMGHDRNKKKWLLVIDGNSIIVEDLTKWCKENGYNYSGVHSAYQAKRKYKDIERIEQHERRTDDA